MGHQQDEPMKNEYSKSQHVKTLPSSLQVLIVTSGLVETSGEFVVARDCSTDEIHSWVLYPL